MPLRKTWDIFCTVVDNFGDIGVTWRLARQLTGEHGRTVRLWVDDLESFRRIAPGLDPTLDTQMHRGVQVCRWTGSSPDAGPADAVIEAFACHLPEAYVEAMAARETKPAWINLEYLSAQGWVEESHALPSPHPHFALTKFFFFPGFTEKTGGLLREHDLIVRRDAFQRDAVAQEAFWNALGVPPRAAEEIRVSLFSYANPSIPSLLQAWSESEQRVTCLFPEGPALESIEDFFGTHGARHFARGNLSLYVLPFVGQDDYDELLWASDINFVRGEDSFLRAQWAARPFVWHIYPQQDDAHWPKLEAFLDLYTAGLDPGSTARIKYLWHAWNRGAAAGAPWRDFAGGQAGLQRHAAGWGQCQAARSGLAENLAKFCDNLL
jgi:uncharacterized repeat protein (TIGR03837 family)